MKKFKILSLIIAGAIIVMFSCTKENNESIKQTNPAESNLTQMDLKVNNLIKTFKEKMAYYKANPDLKDGETVSADSALWYLEATINYSHAFPNDYYKQFEIDTSYLTVPVNSDGTVDMSVLTQKYEEMKTNVAADYHDSQFTEKGLSYVDVEHVSNNGNEMTFSVETGTGEKDGGVGPSGPFGEDDYWWYGEDMGHCDWTGTTDAAQQLWFAMNDDIPDPNGQYYFTNLTPIVKKGGNPDVRRPNDVLDNNYDYYLYSTRTDVNPPFHQYNMLCLEPNEMNTYFSYLKYLLYTKIPNEELPPGYAIESVIFMQGTFENIAQSHKHYFHWGKFQFGLKVNYSSPAGGPEEL